MTHTIAIRNETKSPWERRTPLTPGLVQHLVHDRDIDVVVQSSSRRVFHDKEFLHAGASVRANISGVPVVFGVKEIPEELLETETTYMYFSHVIKGQPYNMAMLQRVMDLRCTLIDYELVRDEHDRRLVFFGRFAGLAGMIDTLWAMGRRYSTQGIETPFISLQPAHAYDDLEHAKEAIRKVAADIRSTGLPKRILPLTIGVAGYGNVAQGAQEVLSALPIQVVSPDRLHELLTDNAPDPHTVICTTFREEDLVEPVDADGSFDLQDYYNRPERYRSRFEPQLAHLSVLVNANYWDERYPRLVTLNALRTLFGGSTQPKLTVIGDLGCDIGGNVECTVRCTDPGDPVFVWNPDTGKATSGFEGRGIAVQAVDILPAELPKEASEEFAAALEPFVANIAKANYSVPFDELDLPPEIKGAVIVHRGQLTPDFTYLEEHLPQS